MTSVRYVLAAKNFHAEAGLMARLRAFYWAIIRRYETELCQRCGRRVQLVFHVPDEIWERITGHARSPSGECAPGVLCPACVDELIDRTSETFPRWTCRLDDEVMVG